MRRHALVILLLAVFWAMAVSVSPRVGATSDERVHLVGGYSYWKFNDYRLHPENGNLTMRLQALPLLAMNLRFPALASEDFARNRANDVGHEFLFGLGNPFTAMLGRARGMVALLGAFVLWLAWRWSCHLFGSTAGWLTLGVGAFCPTLLAHSGLATSDVAITAGFLAALSACWLLLHRATWVRLLLASLAVSAALLAKFSALLLVPLALLLLVVRWLRPTPLVLAWGSRTRWVRRRPQVVGLTLGLAAATGLGALAAVWGAYGFRYSAFDPQLAATAKNAPALAWPPAYTPGAPPADLAARAILTAREHHLLPEAYLFGLTDSYLGSRRRPAFLMGEFSTTGWTQFFPVAFLLKTPPSFLLLLLAGLGALLVAHRRSSRPLASPRWPRRGWLYRSTPLLALFGLYGAMALTTPLNIGHRHLLPIYPILYVFLAAATGWLGLVRRRWTALGLLVSAPLLHALDSWTTRPFYLAYFTPWIGGPERGWHYLVDSSIDWGQGLPDLAAWIRAKAARGDQRPVFLSYFGTDSPAARQLPVTRFGDRVQDLAPRTFPAQVRGGWFVISVTHFQGVYLGLSGPWTAARETRYRELLASLRSAPPNPSTLPLEQRQLWARRAMEYEELQFGRLCHFLRERTPDAFIACSLLIFELSDPEVQSALYGPVNPR
jgi:hypothetical protein